ncbi:MAG: acyl--CoA ligase, partial [Actinobacteria bacterium]|nr:acyl--CoA ligase [Actinomycetota bacterium]
MRDVVTTDERRDRYVEAGWWTGATLAERIVRHAQRQPGQIAVVDRGGERRVTYAQLHDDVTSLAAELRAAGINGGDVISIQLPNCYEAVVFAAAAQAAGGVINPSLPSYRAHEIGHVYTTARPKLHVTTTSGSGVVTEAASNVGHQPIHVALDLGETLRSGTWLVGAMGRTVASLPPPSDATPDANRVSELIFTSGTEATPK